MATARRRSGLVCTFYSYKGGVGRSMALANIAVLLSRLGQKLLVIDWDLEAPGLEQYFGPQYRSLRKSTPGLVDLIGSYGSEHSMDWRECLLKAAIPQGAAVDILHAGRDDPGYSERLRALSWDRLFDQGFGRYLEDMRRDWKQTYDYIFVDSRTGITDIGGICTILLPDYLLSLFTTSEQSVLGVKDAMTRARDAQRNLPLDRQRLIIIPIAARDESTTEYKRAAEWRKRFARELSGFYDDWIHKDETAESVLDYLKIPYIAYWSFGEQLSVLAEDAGNPKTLAYSYALIARLIHSRLDWSEVREGRGTAELQAQHAAEVQTRLAEAAKVRTEALSLQQAESNKIYEERKAAQLARFRDLVEDTRRKRTYRLLGAGTTFAASITGMGYLVLARGIPPGSFLEPGYLIVGLAIFWLASWGFLDALKHGRRYDALQRELAAYTIAHGPYADLGNEARLRKFGETIERLAAGADEDAPQRPAMLEPPKSSSSAADSTSGSMPPANTASAGPAPSSGLPRPSINVEEVSAIDVLLTYPREGIAQDWALEFAPLFSRWLSEMLGRSANVFDATPTLQPGAAPQTFQTAASKARIAVAIMSGRTREMESAVEWNFLLERFAPGRLFVLRLGPSSRHAGLDSRLASLQWTDFSDLAYVGEGFAKSERYIEFQDRVRALAQSAAEAIEQQELTSSPPVA